MGKGVVSLGVVILALIVLWLAVTNRLAALWGTLGTWSYEIFGPPPAGAVTQTSTTTAPAAPSTAASVASTAGQGFALGSLSSLFPAAGATASAAEVPA